MIVDKLPALEVRGKFGLADVVVLVEPKEEVREGGLDELCDGPDLLVGLSARFSFTEVVWLGKLEPWVCRPVSLRASLGGDFSPRLAELGCSVSTVRGLAA
ncbi:MAG: hypothetical protein NZ899_14625 [Thermoguttaceae bacterium]|nr:hypothetical protein [Thermoguttaceae bacterium]MDW8079063.1 hypothetical protein [Thermoguttaceae bacterium]